MEILPYIVVLCHVSFYYIHPVILNQTPSSADVKERVKLYVCPALFLHCMLQGEFYLSLLFWPLNFL